jgi:hypothetical protein
LAFVNDQLVIIEFGDKKGAKIDCRHGGVRPARLLRGVPKRS